MADLFLVGEFGPTAVGGHLLEGAQALGHATHTSDFNAAFKEAWIYRRVARRVLDDYPLNGFEFNLRLQFAIRQQRPRWLLTTGKAPVFASTLQLANRLGTRTINYSTDDPFNRSVGTRWYHKALHHYQVHASPRRSNLAELEREFGGRVSYVPFGYSRAKHYAPIEAVESQAQGDVLFVGQGDRDRFWFFEPLVQAGIRPVLYGGGWSRSRVLRPFWRGFADLETQRRLYQEVPISICLVRRANRDGHVMRTFEAPLFGACLAMEDTDEHRDIFGEDGKNVVYFDTPSKLVETCRLLMDDAELRSRLRKSSQQHILRGGHSYTNRLERMLRL
jgi:hypothetical protein